MNFIFDLDQTLVDSSALEQFRDSRNWSAVYKNLNLVRPYPGIANFLQKIRDRGFPMAIVTSTPSSYCNKILGLLGWKFNAIVCYHDTRRRKPYPDPMLLAMNRLELTDMDKEFTYSFGDRASDMVSSKRAGIKAVACTWGAKDVKKLIESGPDMVIKNINDFSIK